MHGRTLLFDCLLLKVATIYGTHFSNYAKYIKKTSIFFRIYFVLPAGIQSAGEKLFLSWVTRNWS